MGMTLKPGDSIRADNGSRAVVTFFEGSTIELVAGTQIELTALDMAGDSGPTSILLKQKVGETVSRVVKLADPASRYEIETPAAVAGVRGSTMRVNVAEDGVTTVGNEGGQISVIAQGVEVKIPVGMRSSVSPGQPPGTPQPITTPSTPAPTETPVPRVGLIALVKKANVAEVHEGDTVIYTYTVTNPGEVPLSNVTVADDTAGNATYKSGDANSNQKLEPGETWIFTLSYTTRGTDPSPLVNQAIASGTDEQPQTVTAESTTSVNIIKLTVVITTPGEGDIITSSEITVAGIVSDPALNQATITVNGNARSIPVVNGNFSTKVNLAQGENTITVLVTKTAEITSSATIKFLPGQ